jgi:nucleoid-associated protein YgaU
MALQTKTFPTGNLFSVAAQVYGDATQWNRIAAANGMTDPFFIGPVTLIIPPANPNASNGGILGG